MKNLMIFNNPEFGSVRVVKYDDRKYVVGNDVAKILEYEDYNRAVRDHCRGGVTYPVTDALGRERETKIIPIGDVYRLIVHAADQSRNLEIKAKAERFESWIFDIVLPSIHETGKYELHETAPRALLPALNIITSVAQKAKQQAFTSTFANENHNEIALAVTEIFADTTGDDAFLEMMDKFREQIAIQGEMDRHSDQVSSGFAHHNEEYLTVREAVSLYGHGQRFFYGTLRYRGYIRFEDMPTRNKYLKRPVMRLTDAGREVAEEVLNVAGRNFRQPYSFRWKKELIEEIDRYMQGYEYDDEEEE
ncbi:hypothetical protein HSX37_16290|uniref:Prophage antirepressor n=1 Tax=Dendrosporobacter quercicolus TaxID=146817 RepID=A0A1G9ZSR3_9FIRM|nr:BRO family protein [Dendrosporobacter quercicolus]NSL49596.1 hypothetical protein [Dendrosporobacter quercicolus DSM 1736]SDN24224.1 Prophage antirepressor [Dendrosporobacter quercicolus]